VVANVTGQNAGKEMEEFLVCLVMTKTLHNSKLQKFEVSFKHYVIPCQKVYVNLGHFVSSKSKKFSS